MLKLVGYLDSPFVRRVAISAALLDVSFEHQALSIFRDYDRFRELNPLVKVPTLVCDDGMLLVDSTLIIDYLEQLAGKTLMPDRRPERTRALHMIGIALVAAEKTVQLIYETRQRPEAVQHQPWVDRLEQQLTSAMEMLENLYNNETAWVPGASISQAELTTAVVWRFVQHAMPDRVDPARFPELASLSARAEQHPHFIAWPLSN